MKFLLYFLLLSNSAPCLAGALVNTRALQLDSNCSQFHAKLLNFLDDRLYYISTEDILQKSAPLPPEAVLSRFPKLEVLAPNLAGQLRRGRFSKVRTSVVSELARHIAENGSGDISLNLMGQMYLSLSIERIGQTIQFEIGDIRLPGLTYGERATGLDRRFISLVIGFIDGISLRAENDPTIENFIFKAHHIVNEGLALYLTKMGFKYKNLNRPLTSQEIVSSFRKSNGELIGFLRVLRKNHTFLLELSP